MGMRADRLDGVGVERGAVLVRDARELGDGLDGADHVVGEHHRGEARVGAEGGLVGVEVDDAVVVDGRRSSPPSPGA